MVRIATLLSAPLLTFAAIWEVRWRTEEFVLILSTLDSMDDSRTRTLFASECSHAYPLVVSLRTGAAGNSHFRAKRGMADRTSPRVADMAPVGDLSALPRDHAVYLDIRLILFLGPVTLAAKRCDDIAHCSRKPRVRSCRDAGCSRSTPP